jgi:2-polyprenyl-6-methoxyphenol hydroxylase-like FAD-dependent oxidoreductase
MDAEVIVIGAGPTGLMLATELALAGVRPIALESRSGRGVESKALNLHPRTAEVLDSRGLLEPLLDHQIVLGDPAHSFFGALPVPLDCAPWRTRYPHQLGVLQKRVEEALDKRLAELGGTVSWEHELVALEQDADGVSVTVAAPGGTRTIHAAYVVGCDGGRSRVRKALNLSFPGTDGTQLFVAADVVLSRSPREWYAEVAPERRALLRLLPGNTLAGPLVIDGERRVFSLRELEDGVHRLSFSGSAGERDTEVTDTEIRAAIKSACGVDLEITEIRWASRFSNACRQVERYRTGRVLLAGDAAHIVVPLGGQGLNLGVQDAFNLGWKLAAQVTGRAPDGLLDSYQTERHPVAAELLREARAQFAMMDGGEDLAPLREIMAELLRLPDTNRHLAGVVSGLGVRHEMPDQDHPLVGRRLPDLDLHVADGLTRAYGLLHGGRGLFLDLGGGPAATELLGGWSDRVDTVVAESDDDTDTGAVLLRPDGYVCWAGTDLDRLRAALSRWFGAAS